MVSKASLGVGIACTLFLVGTGAVIIYKRRKSTKTPKPPPTPQPCDDYVELQPGKKFPRSSVKNHADISFGEELGGGQFGTVFKGFLHLSELQR